VRKFTSAYPAPERACTVTGSPTRTAGWKTRRIRGRADGRRHRKLWLNEARAYPRAITFGAASPS
jgi:hypothetical protein